MDGKEVRCVVCWFLRISPPQHFLTGSVTDTVMRRAPIPVLVWSGLEQLPSGGWWQGVRQPREAEPLHDPNISIVEWSNL